MAWTRDRGRRFVAVVLCCLAATACDRPGQTPHPDDDAHVEDRGPLGRTDPDLAAACDSIGHWLRRNLGEAVDETRGGYTGSVRGVARHGCSFTATATLEPGQPRPLESVWQTLAEQGWVVDEAYTVEATEGRMIGMRSGSILCVLQHYWDVASDDERAAAWLGPVEYHVRAECFRDAARDPQP